jgi:hypothetical protein
LEKKLHAGACGMGKGAYLCIRFEREAFRKRFGGKKEKKKLLRIKEKFLPLQPAPEGVRERKKEEKNSAKRLEVQQELRTFAPRKRANGSSGIETETSEDGKQKRKSSGKFFERLLETEMKD